MIKKSFINCIRFWDRISSFSVDDDDLNFVIYYMTLDDFNYSIKYDGDKLNIDCPVHVEDHLSKFLSISREMKVNVGFNWVKKNK